MKGIISIDRVELELIDKLINDGMKIQNLSYNAERWGDIHKHPKENKFILIINEDSRNPMQFLTNKNKLKNIEIDIDEWFPPHD